MTFSQLTRRIMTAAAQGGAAVMLLLAALLLPHLLGGYPWVPLQVADYIIETTPADNALRLQQLFGIFSLPSAILGGVMITASVGLISGIVYWLVAIRAEWLAVIAASIVQVGLLAGLFSSKVTLFALAPLALTGPALWWLWRWRATSIARNQPPADLSRRELLSRIGIFSLGGIVLGVIKGLPTIISELNALRPARKLFDFTAPLPRIAGFPVKGLSPEVTPVESFYKMRKFPTPIPDVPVDWRLTINGLVENPISETITSLMELPRTDVFLTRECISNPVGGNMISTALMSGVPLATLLDRAGVKAGAVELIFYGRDGYSENIPLDYGRTFGLLVYGMNGVALPEAHGAPARIEMPGLYGFKSLKWLDRIEVVSVPYQAIWAQQGWTATPVVKTMSRIDSVQRGEGITLIAGIAFAGKRIISKVEVQINDGAWQPATLHAPPLDDKTWVQWRAETPLRGELTIRVRAVDGDGQPQIETVQSQFPDGASGLHTVTVTV